MTVSTPSPKPTTPASLAGTIAYDESGKAWEEYESSLFRGWVPAREQPRTKINPTITWLGSKMAWEVWQEALAFLLWGFRDAKGENQGRFYYNPETGKWAFTATPQWRSTSLSTQEIPPNNTPHGDLWIPIDRQFAHPWEPAGTIHTHGAASAFQSGTDSSDEESQNGLHITVGHCDKSTLDLHSRLYFRKQKYMADLRNWIDLPTFANIPAKYLNMIHEGLLKDPPAETHPFPEEWKKLVVAKVYGTGVGYPGFNSQHNYNHHSGWDNGGFTAPWQQGGKKSVGKRRKSKSIGRVVGGKIEWEGALPKNCRVTEEWADYRSDKELQFIVEVAAALGDANIHLNDAARIWRQSGHPVEVKMMALAQKYGIDGLLIHGQLFGEETPWAFSEIVEAAVALLGPEGMRALAEETEIEEQVTGMKVDEEGHDFTLEELEEIRKQLRNQSHEH